MVVVVAIGILVLLAAITLAALEGYEVVVLRSFGPDGQASETRTWIADAEGAAWIEAANPERAFLEQLRRNPEVELIRGGLRRRCRSSILSNPEGHEQIRRLLNDKYGWADLWIGWIADTSRSLAVRLECEQAASLHPE